MLIDLPADLSRTEPDPEIQDLIRASAGLNIAFDYLPGATMFDPVADRPDAAMAASIVWLDALTLNVDRTARNPNLLMWHRRLWLIDHGAALYFHHRGGDYRERARDAFPLVAEHVLLPFAAPIGDVDDALAMRLAPAVVEDIVEAVPDAWLEHDRAFASAQARRDAYVDFLHRRLVAPRAFVTEAERARSMHV